MMSIWFPKVLDVPGADFLAGEAGEWVAKSIGAVAGSLISLAYILPRGRREAALRLTVGLATGLTFGGTAGVKIADLLGLLGKVSAIEVSLMGASLSSLCAWWGLGVLQRLAERWPDGRQKTKAEISKRMMRSE